MLAIWLLVINNPFIPIPCQFVTESELYAWICCHILWIIVFVFISRNQFVSIDSSKNAFWVPSSAGEGPHLALFDISISNIDCRYIDTFEKYRYRYGHFENIDIDIDIDKAILENIDIEIDIDKAILKISISISISIGSLWEISISISISIRGS